MINLTESDSKYQDLEKMSIRTLLESINQEDQSVPIIIHSVIPQVEALIEQIVPRMQAGGRLFYIGAGTSGRLGIVDASECPPTFGVPHDLVIGIIAGGDVAIRKAVEFAEDDLEQAYRDLQTYHITSADCLIGIAASGRTPYVLGGVRAARQLGVLTGCIVCNIGSPIAAAVEYAIEIPVGAEFLTGSTRMKAGTAQKLVLNMLSTTVMIQLGRVRGNKMVDMQLSNHKLIDRGVRMVIEATQLSLEDAQLLLAEYGSVRAATEAFKKSQDK